MAYSELTLMGLGALGGAIYGLVGYLAAKKKDGEELDLNRLTAPILHGVIIGGIGVYLGPSLGLGTITTAGEALGLGLSGSYAVQKALGISDQTSIIDTIKAILQKVTGK